jgi:hypothetical protein
MTLVQLAQERDKNMQDFRNKLDDLQSIREELSDILDSYDSKIFTLANSADLYPHLNDDLETIKTILQDYNALPTRLCRSIDTLQHLLRKYMGF